MGSDESHFNISLVVRDKVTRQCPQTTTVLKRKESRSGIEPGSFRLPAYRALPLGQTGSRWVLSAYGTYSARQDQDLTGSSFLCIDMELLTRSSPHSKPSLLVYRRAEGRVHKWGLHGVRFVSYSIRFWNPTNRHNLHTSQKEKKHSVPTNTLTGRSAVFRQWVSDWQSSEQLQPIRTSQMIFCAKFPKSGRYVWSTS